MNEQEYLKTLPLGGEGGGLEGSYTEWERNRVRYTLDACLSEVRDRKADIEALFVDNKKKTAEALVMKLVGNELAQAGRTRLRVPEYVEKGKSNQQIYIYVGSHWELVPIQIFYDFCKAGAKKMGLSDLYAEDQDFMCDVFENVAFRVMGYTKTVQPVGVVWINLKNGTVEIMTPPPSPAPRRGSNTENPATEGSNNINTYNPAMQYSDKAIFPPASGRGKGVGFHDHRPEDFFMYCLPYSYDPYAECPLWHQFLDEILPDKNTQRLLGEYIGYCFTKNLKLEKMAVFYGSGANGKSVVMDVLRKLFGRTNVSESTLSSVTTDPEARAQLQNKLVNISSESGRNIDPSILKMMVSGEAVEIRILYVGTKLLTDPPKLITSYNELPPMENTYGYRRRWLLFPFDVTIPEDRQDPDLANKLCTELPGILNWVLGLLADLIRRVASNNGEGFTMSEMCVNAMNEYNKNSNSVLAFLEDCCTIDKEVITKAKEAYSKYIAYCKSCGIGKPFTQKKFKKFAKEWGAEESEYAHVHYLNIAVDTSSYE